MKGITRKEYENLITPAKNWVVPLVRRAQDILNSDNGISIVEIEKEDVPEDQRYRFDKADSLQSLAGLFRQRLSPLDDMKVSCRNGKLFLIKIDNEAVYKKNRR